VQNSLGILREELVAQGRSVDAFPTDAVVHLQRGREVLEPEVAAWKETNPTWVSLSTMANKLLTGDVPPINRVDAQIALLEQSLAWVKSL
jgi:hypothetical protein